MLHDLGRFWVSGRVTNQAAKTLMLLYDVALTRIKACMADNALQEKRLNTMKKVVAITTNVVVIDVIATTKKSMQTIVINFEVIGLCNDLL